MATYFLHYIFFVFIFQFVGSRQKLMIVNLFKSKMLQQPTLKVKEVVKIISKELGIGKNTIQSTIAEYKKKKNCEFAK